MKTVFQKISGLALLCIFSAFASYGQTNNMAPDTAKKAGMHFNQYAGVQINSLVQQVLNFNNSNATTPLNNPYLFTYAIDDARTNDGLRIGLGITYNQTTTSNPATTVNNNITDLQFRLGYEKRMMIGKRWETGFAADLLLSSNNDFTTTTVNSFETDISKSSSVDLEYGIGPSVWLNYYITKKILIGTEASLYYTRGNPRQTVEETVMIPGQPTQYNSTTSSNFTAQAAFVIPEALYIIVKF